MGDVRKHEGIFQRGTKKGQLKPGYKYTGARTSTGLPRIVKVGSVKNAVSKYEKQVRRFFQ